MRSGFGRYGFSPHPLSTHQTALRRAFTGHPMSQAETLRDLQRLLEDLDREMDKLRVVLRHGSQVREQIAAEIAVLKQPSGNDP